MPPAASWLHRTGALCVDWAVSTLAVISALGLDGWSSDPLAGTYTLAVFVLESALFTALLGGSFGKLVTRLRVVRTDADGRMRTLGPAPALLRSVLVALVIPPLVFRPDGRGLHDLAVGSVTVRLADLRGRQPGAG